MKKHLLAIVLAPEKLSYSLWDLKLATLPNGIYRIDVLLDSDFVWRTFFRMVTKVKSTKVKWFTAMPPPLRKASGFPDDVSDTIGGYAAEAKPLSSL